MNPNILALNFVIAFIALAGITRLVQLFNRKYHEASDFKAKAESLDTQLRLLQRRKNEDDTALNRQLSSLTNENRHMRNALQRHFDSGIASIKFYVRHPFHMSQYKETEFKLGLGPCGKVATAINVMVDDDQRLVIEQVTEDGERKAFYYRKDDIKGRIVKTFKYKTTPPEVVR